MARGFSFRGNKKGVMFILTMAAFSLVLLFTFATVNLANSETINRVAYGQTLGQLDQLQFQSSSFDLSVSLLLSQATANIENDLIRSQLLQKVDTQGIFCVDGGVLFLYDDSVESIEIVISEEESIIRNGCLLESPESFVEDLTRSLSENLEIPFRRLQRSLGLQNELEISFQERGGDLLLSVSSIREVQVRTLIVSGNQPTLIRRNFEYSKTLSLGSFPELIMSLNQNLPLISQELEVQVPSCISTAQADRSSCMESSALNFISQVIPSQFNAQTRYLGTRGGLIELEFSIHDTQFSRNPFTFRVRVEDKIPLGLVDFELNPSTRFSNAASLRVFKPEHIDESLLHGYVILYSDINFFNPQTFGQQRFERLVSLLEQGLIPLEFERFGAPQLDPFQFFISRETDNLNLNMIFIPWRDVPYQVGQGGVGTFFEVDLYQIYNFNSRQFERISSPQLYAYVFAVGVPTPQSRTFNYFVDPLQFSESIQSTPILSLAVPSPIVPEQFSIANSDGSLDGLERGFSFSVSGYDDSSASMFTLFIIDSSTTQRSFPPQCEGMNNCYFYTIQSLGTLPIIISSLSQSTSSLSQYSASHQFISSTQFRDRLGNPLILENSRTYQFGIVPVSAENQGIFEPQSQRSQIQVSEFDNRRFYFIEEQRGLRVGPLSQQFLIRDRRAPDPIQSITVQQTVTIEDSQWVLTWIPDSLENIEGLFLTYEELSATGSVINTVENQFFSGRPTRIPKTGEGIRITRIIPQDTSGNFEENPLQTHTAQFIIQQQTTQGE